IEFTLLNIKALIAYKLTANSFVDIEDLKAISIGAAAKYAAFELEIPSSSSSTGWKWAGDLVRFVPSSSVKYMTAIKSMKKRHRQFLSLNK
ncbi:Hypothetical protein FKW44_008414, partial [Caligus rogercresseyi]